MRLTMFDKSRYYVSLGDSISIDAYAGGPGCGAASLFFKNREADFPDFSGQDMTTRLPGVRLIPLAMDGATSATVRYYQIPRLKEMAVVPDVVTITIGGNDLIQCWLNDSAADAANRALREHGTAILADLRRMLGENAPIVVSTIYDPSDGLLDFGRLELLRWDTASTWLAAFNTTLTEVAREQGVLLADIHRHFLGHGITAGNPAQSEARPSNRELYYCGTIEPNAWGAGAVRACWWDTLTGAGIFCRDGIAFVKGG